MDADLGDGGTDADHQWGAGAIICAGWGWGGDCDGTGADDSSPARRRRAPGGGGGAWQPAMAERWCALAQLHAVVVKVDLTVHLAYARQVFDRVPTRSTLSGTAPCSAATHGGADTGPGARDVAAKVDDDLLNSSFLASISRARVVWEWQQQIYGVVADPSSSSLSSSISSEDAVMYVAAASADASETEARAAHVDPEGAPRRAGDGDSEDGGELAALRMEARSRPLRRRGRGRGGALRRERGMVSRGRQCLS
ncbi:hypothetical protein ZEAMMB73_Zm00001d023442 [Zea mays]|uniref:Uncharacterized protein n=1 Tax=Zea mays TaxID=4577 RepID=K7TMC5_MAIZE|nr:hypothetical protein ZEAMMB73_Zm00001d023442 [Zea mays]